MSSPAMRGETRECRAERLPLLALDRGLARAAQRLGLKMMEFENEGL